MSLFLQVYGGCGIATLLGFLMLCHLSAVRQRANHALESHHSATDAAQDIANSIAGLAGYSPTSPAFQVDPAFHKFSDSNSQPGRANHA